ncbi:GNAT family N-acetyltransferase [Paenibacillus physcomitrellae]|uniref:N-acetyltransferase n=1 Tax=Paenibacillus physcomitrellae TaxID=1619311 RepID=A0ABQ1GHI4_9BACL|nr:GNAT family N-acetyltransferase [Paenibacillus physcomitrellae]GGA43579.1 N-acetyltransferase [Paenibacillus physcomitrellae]
MANEQDKQIHQAEKDAIVIRDAQEEDQPNIERLLLEAYGQYEEVMAGERWLAYRESIRDSVYKEGPVARIVAELNGEIVGSVQMFLDSEVAYGRSDLNIQDPIIRLLATSPQARGRGVATLLIRESIERSRQLGGEMLYLHSSDLMAPAIRLYEHLGFVRTPEKEMLNGTTLVKCFSIPLHPEKAGARTVEAAQAAE